MIDCPKCNHWNTEYYGVTESGNAKYICRKCYHKYEIPYKLHKDWKEAIDNMAEKIREEIDNEIISAIKWEIYEEEFWQWLDEEIEATEKRLKALKEIRDTRKLKYLTPVPKEDIEVVDLGPPSNQIFAQRINIKEKNKEDNK